MAKVKRRRGRKPREGVARYPGGQIVHADRRKQEAPTAVALAVRRRRYGANACLDPHWGYELGRLLQQWLQSGKTSGVGINQRQHDAGQKWAETCWRLARLEGFAAPVPRCLNLDGLGGVERGEPTDPDALDAYRKSVAEARRAYADTFAALRGAPHSRAAHACREVCLRDTETDNWPPSMMQALREGLNALAWHFQVAG